MGPNARNLAVNARPVRPRMAVPALSGALPIGDHDVALTEAQVLDRVELTRAKRDANGRLR